MTLWRDDEQRILAARNRTAHEQQITLCVGAYDFKILQRRTIDAVMAWAPASFSDTSRVRVAVGGRLTMNHRAVTGAAAAEVVPFDAAGEAVTFGDARDVDTIARLESRKR